MDYYFDQNDEQLQLADEQGNYRNVIRCIEKGLDTRMHLFAILTENTKKSRWVPYKIGSAISRGQDCAYLIDKEVSEPPSHIKASKVLPNRQALLARPERR